MDYITVFFTTLTLMYFRIEVAQSSLRPKAQGRTLLFLPTSPTRIQFIGGIGIPVEDLHFESVTSGYVLKAEYFLPTRAEEFWPTYLRPQTIHRRSADNGPLLPATRHSTGHRANSTRTRFTHRTHANQSSSFADNWKHQQKTASAYRWIVYRGVEMLMNRAGLPGRVCMLRSICEYAAVPLHYNNGMLAELLHIVLTPSSSLDDFDKPFDNRYLTAEIMGRRGVDCAHKFSACASSPIDQISTIFDFTGDFSVN